MIGQTISQYQITDRLGVGGMGVVYKALDTTLNRPVALKFLPLEGASSEGLEARFLREAQAASALDHVNICTIYGVGETEEGQKYIAMAYYEGETLKQKLHAGRLDLDNCLDIAIQIAHGLAAAHGQGIVHRDMKPANVIVTTSGVVKILDFGLAKIADVSITRSGETMGTVPYMSPEQVRGESVDQRTDLWSLGVLFYEILTGKRPFEGDSAHTISHAILEEKPKPVTRVRIDIPAILDQIVEKALQKDLSKRYQHTEDLLADLEQAKVQLLAFSQLRTVPLQMLPPDKGKGLRRHGLILGTATFLLLAGIVAASFMRDFSTDAPMVTPAESDAVDTVQHHGTGAPAIASQDENAGVDNLAETNKTVDSSFAPPIESTDELARYLVLALSEQARRRGQTILVAPFTYQNTQIASSFSKYFKQLLEGQLMKAEGWIVVQQAHGVETNSADLAHTFAQASGAAFQLTGTYGERSGAIVFKAALRHIADGAVVARAEASVPAGLVQQVPYPIKPQNFSEALQDLQTFHEGEINRDELRVEVWTDRGKEQLLYTEGEEMTLFVRVNAPAYVRFIYHLAGGTRTLLLDNHFIDQGGVNTPYRIPGQFVCAPPFGVEVLQAITQTEPFEALDVQHVEGYKVLKQDLKRFLATTRSAAKKPKAAVLQAEDRVVITTIARQ